MEKTYNAGSECPTCGLTMSMFHPVHPAQNTDDVAAKKRLFDRYADAVLRRKVAEIELREATAEFEFASNAYLTMLAEERRAALNDG